VTTVSIPLTQGKVAIIDEADLPLVAPFKWYLQRHTEPFYALGSLLCRGGFVRVSMHRLIIDAPPASHVDHINGDGLDNRRCNLRLVTRAQNMRNRRISTASVSGFKGLDWIARKSKWRARIKCDSVNHHICYFASAEEAARAYDAKARELFGEYARCNFPD
jgi:hypothetical protein